MNKLYAPWRSQYSRTADENSGKADAGGCVFCSIFAQTNDAQNFVLGRFSNVIAILNTYPYNAGHLMLLPIAHVPDIDGCSKETRLELMDLTNSCIKILEKTLKCQGINVGINLGQPAGGSQPGHLHIHILPRWTGDTNFLAALADTKMISFDLREIYAKLRPEFDRLSE